MFFSSPPELSSSSPACATLAESLLLLSFFRRLRLDGVPAETNSLSSSASFDAAGAAVAGICVAIFGEVNSARTESIEVNTSLPSADEDATSERKASTWNMAVAFALV